RRFTFISPRGSRSAFLLRGLSVSLHPGADLAGDAGAAKPAVAVRVLGEVLLVVVLGEIEFGRRQDLGGDRSEPARLQRLLVGCLRGFRGTVLLVGEIIDAGAILRADVV